MKNKVAFLNVASRTVKVKEVDEEDIIGPVDWGIHCHLELYKSYKYDVYDEHNVICLGMGKLAGGVLPGSHRLIGCFRSPLTGGFFVSTMGGAAYAFKYLGVDFSVVEGKSSEPLIVALKGTEHGIEAKWETISEEKLIKIFKGYKDKKGVYALHEYVLDKVKDFYIKDGKYMTFRIAVIGPAAVNTNNGAVFSAVLRGDKVEEGAEDWMARGGGGSVLYKAHRVVAIAFGGDYDWRKVDMLKNVSKLDEVFTANLGKKYMEAVTSATVKYRYNEKIKSGGTFGGNYSTLKDRTLLFNWTQMYLDIETRTKIYSEYIVNHYLKQFNERIIEKKSFKTCGEPCVAVCKKVEGPYKVDYEPYSANGPLCGIFDFDTAHTAVHAVDTMGFDAIEFGNTAAWVLEALHIGLLTPDDLGVSGKPYFDVASFKLEYSKHNAEIVAQLAEKIAFAENEVLKAIGEGIRRASRKLSEIFSTRVKEKGKEFKDIAVYVPFGEDGAITPCQYWDPAFIVPLPFQGTFMTKYHAPFMEPEEFAKACADRLFKELYSENFGFCRFHRGWWEKLSEKLFNTVLGANINFYEHSKKLVEKVIEYDIKAGCKPVFWESERTVDIFATYIEDEAKKGNETAAKWLEKVKQSKVEAAKEYWTRFLKEFEKITGKSWS
ncbi:MAG TPA: glyceraldehyde-3-phosphate:ferredoxin oxidoreductase [Thermoprotei archaeon]|nr:MAG: glyceraldehyde-3-phosphate:ferredoxin oxidoreductase [Thermoprotei archaeon]HDI74470.1 glyceraldehyde-3-phosphate:ferredoxin oxidoreductase [Thermoprotei archaeon]